MIASKQHWPDVRRAAAFAVWIGIVTLSGWAAAAAEGTPPTPPSGTMSEPSAEEIPAGALEVVRLAESGVEEDVILTYIDGASKLFALEADDIIHLNDLGISSGIVTAMLRRDAALSEHAIPPATSANPPAAGPPSATVVTNVPPATATVVYVTNAPAHVVQFYDPLLPYGTWIELEGYGWCWQPTIVVVDPLWRPYWHGGRWIYSDCGWYWYSDYSWGWAPFHYGRWHRHHRHGWVWFPDLVWGPAWVSWRFHDVHCGWAPLPPGAHFVMGQGWRFNNLSVGIDFNFHLGADLYTYVELGHLHDRRLHLRPLPPARVKEIHQGTTVINNYSVGPNNRIFNHGAAVDRVAAASRGTIPRVTISDVPPAQAGLIKRDRMATVGSQTRLYRPQLQPPARPGPAVAQRIDEQRAIVRSTPQRPPGSSLPRIPESRGRTRPPATVPPAKTPPPRAAEPRSVTSAPTTAVPRVAEPRPVPPGPAPGTRVNPPSMKSILPAPTTVVRPPPSRPPGQESPRGREQRISSGATMQRPLPPSTQPRPTPGTAAKQRPATDEKRK